MVGRVLLVIAVVALTSAACSKGGDTSAGDGTEGGSTEGDTITLEGQTANDHGTKDVAGGGSVEVEVDDYYFDPTVLAGSAGEQVTLELKNEGSVEHSFVLDEQSIDQDLEPGDGAEVTVTFPDSGTLVFYCKYHQNSGMRGGLQVA